MWTVREETSQILGPPLGRKQLGGEQTLGLLGQTDTWDQ